MDNKKTMTNKRLEYHSQYGQDRYFDQEIFKGKTNGFFLEIGSDDGISLSNTYFFEKNRNWRGICVEPRKVAFDILVNNRGCICENACIAEDNGQKEFLEIKGSGAMLSGLYDNYDPKHLERIEREHGGDTKTILQVKCITVDDLLKRHDVINIDYCSIDTEGNEMDVLNSIDFSRVKIHFFTIENNYHDPRLEQFMEKNGYLLIDELRCDEIYGLKEDILSLQIRVNSGKLRKLKAKRLLNKIFSAMKRPLKYFVSPLRHNQYNEKHQ